MTLFITLYNVLSTFQSVDEFLKSNHLEMKVAEQNVLTLNFSMLLFMALYKMVLTYVSVDVFLKWNDLKNVSCRAELSYFAIFCNTRTECIEKTFLDMNQNRFEKESGKIQPIVPAPVHEEGVVFVTSS